jgi:hypothetical protein
VKRKKAESGGASAPGEASEILTRLTEDGELRDAIAAISATGAAIAAAAAIKNKRKRRLGFGRLLMLTVVGGIATMVLSEGARTKVLDTLFGKEEEFEYSPPPPPSADGEPSSNPLSAV